MISVLTLTLLLAVLFRRVTNRVLRMMSNFDDYFSWFITTLVIVTGLAATAHIGGPYQTLLALHILSFDALLIWFPFGKLMHAFYHLPLAGHQRRRYSPAKEPSHERCHAACFPPISRPARPRPRRLA